MDIYSIELYKDYISGNNSVWKKQKTNNWFSLIGLNWKKITSNIKKILTKTTQI